MSRFLVSRLFWAAMKPIVQTHASRSSAMILSSAKSQLTRTSRFMASWGSETVVDPKEIEFRVLKCIASHDKINSEQLTSDSHFMNDLGLDSLDQVELIVGIEDEFNIEIEDINSEKLLSVKDVVDYLINHFKTTDPSEKNPGYKLNQHMEFGNAEK